MQYPKTNKEWWANVEACWPAILENHQRAGLKLDSTITKPDGSVVTLLQTLEKLKADRNGKGLHGMLNSLWLAAPDKPVIHTWPHWHDICDLCSESHCVYEDDPDYVEG